MKKLLTYIMMFVVVGSFTILVTSVNVHADGTETLGPPLGITVASGTGIATGGTGMNTQPGVITVDVPVGAIVKQVLLYWDGQSIGSVPGDNIISANDIVVTGALIGGPAYFFTTYKKKIWSSSFRADITSLGLIAPGLNTLTIGGMSFSYINNGAGVLVIYENGVETSDIQIRDGLDLAYDSYFEPRKSTVPQTFNITPAAVDRTAQVLLFVGSVHDNYSQTFRPNSIEINVTANGVISTYVYSNYLNSNDGLYWDSLMLDVLIPGEATELTIQVFSRDDTNSVSCNSPASLEWIGAMVSIPAPPLSNEPDLSITKTASPDPVTVGQNLTYTITVTNNGPDQANGVTVMDALPLGVAYVSALPSQGSCSGTNTVTCSIGSLPAGGSATISIVVTTLWDGIICNSASVIGAQSDPNIANNLTPCVPTTVSPLVSPIADLSVSKSDSPDPVNVGDSLLYTITATNNGPSNATGVTVTDTLPTGITLVSVTPSQGSCTGTLTVTCSLGNIVNGASANVPIVVIPTVAGTLNNSASVTGNENDPNITDNTTPIISTVVTVITPPTTGADLAITKTDSPDPVILAGGQITYTITVTNNGPEGATGVKITDTLPGGVTFLPAFSDPRCSEIAPGTVECAIGNLLNSSTDSVIIVVSTSTNGMIGNTASVTLNETDPNMINNSSMATTNVGDVSRLLNISTRAYVGTGTDREVAGFIIGGSLPKTVLVRGFGPSMSSTIAGTLANPYLEVYSFATGTYIAQNDNWGNQSDTLCTTSGFVCSSAAEISATGQDPCQQSGNATGCTNESSLLITLPPGAYTARLSGVNNGTGVGRIGVSDLDATTLPKLDNLSTRAMVLTGTSAAVGGFIIGGGTGNKTVLIRGFGPSMSGTIAGTLANPYLELYSFTKVAYIAQNDDWGDQSDTLCSSSGFVCGSAAEISATGQNPCQQSGNAAGCTDEATLLITLPPGAYSAKLRGVNNGTGVGRIGISDISQ